MAPLGASNAYPPLVLLVEDDATLRGALIFSLSLEGFRVEACASGEDLLRHPAPALPAVLLLDQRLSGITGLETLQVLRERGVNLPAILITSQLTAEMRETVAMLNARIVEKPLVGAELVEAIRAALT